MNAAVIWETHTIRLNDKLEETGERLIDDKTQPTDADGWKTVVGNVAGAEGYRNVCAIFAKSNVGTMWTLIFLQAGPRVAGADLGDLARKIERALSAERFPVHLAS